MLHDFLTRERNAIITVAKQKAVESQRSRMTSGALEEGWGIFYDELIALLKRDEPFEFHDEEGSYTLVAEKHSEEYLRLGYTISEVVHRYGIICQAITGLATELGYEITSREFRQFNVSLDRIPNSSVLENGLPKFKGSQIHFGSISDCLKLSALRTYQISLFKRGPIITSER
jgi:hypothetical protein